MRVTINIRDDIYQTIRRIAEQHATSPSDVISDLLEQQLHIPVGITDADDGWPVFSVPQNAPIIKQALIDHALDSHLTD